MERGYARKSCARIESKTKATLPLVELNRATGTGETQAERRNARALARILISTRWKAKCALCRLALDVQGMEGMQQADGFIALLWILCY
jgi:hypothetical protein